ncbi:SDR family NAD(P)-dependent oxidoreductase [Derxia lacustris]|uniref:SDR family NAD(P)-dependent oxidoreductase n=1 Tax=Derxia lacustris TaxID=764842 RepID=UPI000A174FDC|nr:glucose 1-dehydrogenase [Derxia lacustris]
MDGLDPAPAAAGCAQDFAGLVALVTGGAAGIGWATAQRLAAGGASVVIADLDGAAAEARAAGLGAGKGARHAAHALDVSEPAQAAAVVARLLRDYGRLDVLINNAGLPEAPAATLDQELAAFERVLKVNLQGSFVMCREAGRAMLAARGGAIVNLASIAGLAGIPTRNAYGAAKAGVVALTRSLACEWAHAGIRVNAVAPGYVRTALVARLEAAGGIDSAAIAGRTPLGRLAGPGEIAEAIAFLASPRASYITGATLAVDGGWLALGAPDSALAALRADPPSAAGEAANR